MGRLFWKFFTFFWLAQLCGGLVIGVMAWLLSQASGASAPILDASPPARFVLSSAVATLRHGGIAALRELIEERSQSPGPALLVVDENQRTLFGQPLAPETLARIRSLAAAPDGRAGVESVPASDGHTYLLFVAPGAHPPPPLSFNPARHSRPSFSPLIGIIAGSLVSLLFAALLARFFSKPIRSLRAAFEAAANGDLEQNLSPAMGNRRDELADLGRDFDRMTQQLKVLMDSQRRLLHHVSHELRSPLARLQAAVGLARQQPERIENSLERIERESVRMDRLVSELLTLSRLEAGMPGQADEAVDVSELLGNVVDDARFEAGALACRIEFVAGKDLFVMGDPELLHRAAENVVRNAVKHSPASGVVEVSACRDAGRVVVRVADQGSGVAEADLAAIFKPFFRSEPDGATDGHGLGLAISRRVVEGLRGCINAANRDTGGLCVTISLPALPAQSLEAFHRTR